MEIKYSPTTTDRGLEDYVNYLKIPKMELKGSVILDLGSGINQQFAEEIKVKNFDSKVISVDPSLGSKEEEDLLRHDAGLSAKARRLFSYPFTLAADAVAIPFKNNSVDRVYALYSVPWISPNKNIGKTLKEIDRVLKNNGVFRAYPLLKTQKIIVEPLLKQIPSLRFKFSKKMDDDAYLLVATKS